MREVCLLGTSETSWHRAPLTDPSIEKWGIGSGHHLYGAHCDRLYELHFDDPDPTVVSGIDKSFWTWAPTCPTPIYMIDVDPRVPSSVRFPIEAVIAHCGDDYFTCSVAFMLAQAMLEGVDRIHLYGIDLSTVGEYSFERPCVEYWIGKIRGQRGDDAVQISKSSFIAKCKELYGYRTPASGYDLYRPTNFGSHNCVFDGVKISGMYLWQYNSEADKAAHAARD